MKISVRTSFDAVPYQVAKSPTTDKLANKTVLLSSLAQTQTTPEAG